MANSNRPLDGIRVVELATYIAVPACGRILADMGADVVKIEAPFGDNLRYTAPTEGRPSIDDENTTWELENAGKRGLGLNTKTEAGMDVLMKLLARADIFLTNWRPDALARAGLEYEQLRARFPKLIYGNVTGWGETGPDKDLPGFDYTAYFARGGMSGSLYQKGTVPMNIIPGIGDHTAGLALSTGVLGALWRARETGKGEKVSVNLLHTSIYTQGIMVQAAQYPDYGLPYPIDRRETTSPFILAYKTSDERFIQVCMPTYDQYFNRFVTAVGLEELVDHPVYSKLQIMAGEKRSPEMYDILWDTFQKRPLSDWVEVLTAADIPFGVAQTWEEVLVDKQAWAVDTFHTMQYPNGNERTLVRPPIDMAETGLPEYPLGPLLGEHSADILAEVGYTPEQVAAMEENKEIKITRRG